MADLNRLTKLFQALADRNWAAAEAVAREVARAEERSGHHAAAQRLRGALHPNGRAPQGDSAGETPRDSPAFLSTALSRIAADRGLKDVQLTRATRAVLQELTVEWSKRDLLQRRGMPRRSKLLFHGPPGCGKSVTARALGHDLGLPVYVVRFDAVVGAYLGQTALHLRQIFRFAEATACVLLIDEIDALGKRRGSPLDVGELDRVVIALLQELEHSHPAGLLVATSNLAGQLDDALWRRFDLVAEFPRPSRHDLQAFWTKRAQSRKIAIPRTLRATLSRAASYADAERLLVAEERRLLLKSR